MLPYNVAVSQGTPREYFGAIVHRPSAAHKVTGSDLAEDGAGGKIRTEGTSVEETRFMEKAAKIIANGRQRP